MKTSLILLISVSIFNCQAGVLGFASPTLVSGIQAIVGTDYPDPWTNVRIYFYFGPGNLQSISYKLQDATQLLSNPKFNINKFTTFYMHGYTENQTYISIPHVKEAYSHLPSHNFVALDYSLYVEGNIKSIDYIPAYGAVPYLAPYISQALISLFDAGLPIAKFHVVAHSLGAQLAGYTGRNLIQMSNYKLPRISGLDPAFPGYYVLPIIIDQLSPDDADFVDVIHTDGGVYGTPFSTGTADFYPNDGHAVQSGCPFPRHMFTGDPNDCCSHWMSWKFWSESVANLYSQKFVSYKANSYLNYKLGFYEDSEPTVMGLYVSLESTGDYYLNTNPVQPYAQG